MLTVGFLKQILAAHPDDMEVVTQENLAIAHISNTSNRLIISTEKPIGHCNRSGGLVFPITKIQLVHEAGTEYDGVCTETDENLYKFEFTPINTVVDYGSIT